MLESELVECKKAAKREQSALEIEFEESRSFIEGELERAIDQNREIEVSSDRVCLPEGVFRFTHPITFIVTLFVRRRADSWSCEMYMWRATLLTVTRSCGLCEPRIKNSKQCWIMSITMSVFPISFQL